jgi:hypothetical protein
MLTTLAIALAAVAFGLFLALSITSGMLVKEQQKTRELEEENSRLRFKLIDASRYMASVLGPFKREEEGEEL